MKAQWISLLAKSIGLFRTLGWTVVTGKDMERTRHIVFIHSLSKVDLLFHAHPAAFCSNSVLGRS
jgi:hypothetical protein